MSTMIQIRNVPDELHRTLKVRAAQAGMTLSAYLLGVVDRSADRPTRQEFLERVRSRTPVKPSIPVVDILREARDSR